MRYFTSDTHFFHEGVIRFGKRYGFITGDHGAKPVDGQEDMFQMYPSGDIVPRDERDRRMKLALDQMHEGLIANWNARVTRKDEIFLVGDFAYKNKRGDADDVKRVYDRLNGKKHLLIGNHDNKDVLALPWATVGHYREIHEGGHSVVMCHYPMRSWNKMYHGSFHFHGHEHGNVVDFSHYQNSIGKGGSCDLSSDAWNWTPMTFIEIEERIKAKGQRNPDLFDASGEDRTKRRKEAA